MSLPPRISFASAFPPHPLSLPEPGTSSYIFFVPFLTSTSRILPYASNKSPLSIWQVTLLSYSSLWVTSPGSPSSFWSVFLSEPLQILKRRRESQQCPIFLTSLSRKRSQKTSSQRFRILFLLWCFWGDCYTSERQGCFGIFALCTS